MNVLLRSGLAACAVLGVLPGCVVQPGTPVVYNAPAPAPVIVRPPPPPIIVERPPPPPGPYYVFRRGHWYWNGYHWVWAPGHYVLQ